jgi:hypothetical protein
MTVTIVYVVVMIIYTQLPIMKATNTYPLDGIIDLKATNTCPLDGIIDFKATNTCPLCGIIDLYILM